MLEGVLKNIRRYALTNTHNLSFVKAACALSKPLTAVYCLSLEVTRGRVYILTFLVTQFHQYNT